MLSANAKPIITSALAIGSTSPWPRYSQVLSPTTAPSTASPSATACPGLSVIGWQKTLRWEAGLHRGHTQQLAKHGQRQRLVKLAVVFGQQGQRVHHAVG
jgi:hypothetical protein